MVRRPTKDRKRPYRDATLSAGNKSNNLRIINSAANFTANTVIPAPYRKQSAPYIDKKICPNI